MNKHWGVLGILWGALNILFPATSHGQVSFSQPPSYGGSGALFVADFNGDGKPDILTSDGTMNLGNGGGTFKPGTSVSVSSGPVLAVADFNGDGRPDVLEQGLGTLLVLLGNGDGTFQAPISTVSGANLSVVAAGDLNGDGKADVVGVFSSTLFVYLSNGNGTFATSVPYTIGATTSRETAVSLGDFNGDKITDIAVTNGGASQEIVFPGKGDGTFSSPKTSVGVSGVGCAAAGDFNGDGKLDLAVSCYVNAPDQYEVYVVMGNGDGTFQTPIAAFAGNGPLAAADVNGDGKLDLVLQEEEPSGPETTVAQIYLGNGDGTFSNASNYILGMPTSPITLPSLGVAIVDLNSDGKLDVAAGNAVLLSDGNGTFQGIQYGAGDGTVPFVIGNFDKGGAPYLANAGVDIYKNNGGGMLSLIESYTFQGNFGGIVTADFNGDRNLDLLVSSVDPVSFLWSYSVLIGNGDGSFQAPVYYPQFPAIRRGVSSVLAADFRNDQKMDVAIAGVDSQSLELLLGNGDGTFAAPVGVFDGGGANLVSADFNGDGKQDIAAGGSSTAILLGNGDGTFQPAVFPTNFENFAVQFAADLNSDGKPDLISSNQVALGNGDGTFTVLPVLPGVYIFNVADLNGDGKPDLIVLNNNASQQIGVLLGNGDGTFGSFIHVLPNTVPLSAFLTADMNTDGRADLVFPWGRGYGVLLNTTQAGFEVSASAVSPSPVTAGHSATSTVSVIPTFGFTGAVTLSCTGLPAGATCSFNPPSVTLTGNAAVNSSLTITTIASTAAGSYSIVATGTSGTTVNTTPMSLTVNPAPDFTVAPAPGSPTSQTISAGQKAMFSLAFGGVGGFIGSVSLTCAISPTVTPPPTCSLSSSSVQIGSTAQTVTLTVSTTAPMTTGALPPIGFPPAAIPLVWTALMLGSGWLLLRNRKRLPGLAGLIVLAIVTLVGCGGSSSSSHTTPGTPAGTYTATVSATSGSVSHSMPLTVVLH